MLTASGAGQHRLAIGVQRQQIQPMCRARLQVANLGAREAASSSACSTSGRATAGGSSPFPPLGGLRPSAELSSTGLACSISSKSSRQQEEIWLCSATGGGDGGGAAGGGGSSGSGGQGSGSDGGDEDELLNLQQAEELAALKGQALPEDMAAAAASGGLRKSVLDAYLKILTGGFLTSLLARLSPAFRNRLIADRLFFFKILAEVAIDSGCATVAEVRKRGEDFWGEFEFYLSDLLVGLVLDVVLVTLIAPVAVLGKAPASAAATGVKGWLGRLPSAMFEASQPGRKYSVTDRAACWVVKALEYSLAGIACGFVGQGIANGMMELKRRHMGPSEHDVPIPPLGRTALVWGLFMGLSSNTRYQIVFGLERLVDMTVAKRIPALAYYSTLIIRFVNNVIGGEQFVDMARWAKIQ